MLCGKFFKGKGGLSPPPPLDKKPAYDYNISVIFSDKK